MATVDGAWRVRVGCTRVVTRVAADGAPLTKPLARRKMDHMTCASYSASLTEQEF
jgi:hypothetical protein